MSSDDRGNRGGRIGTAVLATVLGVGFGLLAAPQTGTETPARAAQAARAMGEDLEGELEDLRERGGPRGARWRARGAQDLRQARAQDGTTSGVEEFEDFRDDFEADERRGLGAARHGADRGRRARGRRVPVDERARGAGARARCAKPRPPSATRPRRAGTGSRSGAATAIPLPRAARGSIRPAPPRKAAETLPPVRAPRRARGARSAVPQPARHRELDPHLRFRGLPVHGRHPGIPAERGRARARPRRGDDRPLELRPPRQRAARSGAAPCTGGVHRGGGPALLLPPRGRLAQRGPRPGPERHPGGRQRGVQHDHHAGRAKRLRARASPRSARFAAS